MDSSRGRLVPFAITAALTVPVVSLAWVIQAGTEPWRATIEADAARGGRLEIGGYAVIEVPHGGFKNQVSVQIERLAGSSVPRTPAGYTALGDPFETDLGASVRKPASVFARYDGTHARNGARGVLLATVDVSGRRWLPRHSAVDPKSRLVVAELSDRHAKWRPFAVTGLPHPGKSDPD
jgi:hypothetical protein